MSTDMSPKFEILLVEDNAADVRLTQEAFKEGREQHELRVVRDGAEALAYLRREGRFRAAPRPHLILLDLNLPRRHGLEVLHGVKNDPELQHIPVVVLTTSDADEDMMAAYRLQASSYIRKPVQLDDFLEVVRSIDSYWLSTVELPRR